MVVLGISWRTVLSAVPPPHLFTCLRCCGRAVSRPAGVLTAGFAAEEQAQKQMKAGLKKKQGISW